MTKVTQMSTADFSTFNHVPVLTRELISGLNICPGGHYLDATVGAGGHTRKLLESYANVRVTAIDRDSTAIAAAAANLAEYNIDRLTFWQGNFANYEAKEETFDGIIADLGVSSPQLDHPERGFSFRLEAPLDMRMDCGQSLTAATVINTWDETELTKIFYNYGEERLSRQIAKQIVKQRPFYSTTELANVIARSVPPKYRYGRIHPATRVFQALRIAVNQELESLLSFLIKSPYWLKRDGIIGVISFHSLEDRIVKHQFRSSPLLKVLTKKPIIPQSDEQAKNPRSRSAKLRLAQRQEA
ncbi:16S rRNA (cytosine(1402)-N(4))-methyltransferase RsmH [Gloeothece verrucosa]|uniref:Ribosomal RNA small subunit methyltransferase H n=1 Tax=Gloeothece verrucosa (strain PCC 7822) TaxID=497965 RepID=E0U7E8_GLOV7|nr:16S rRNA (cytosine(1402)-N(4))-methyltransferase RsmH [Gloeothece verrucosa]ADN13644.1 S-adenosyl-methyltransferase MraW [Gloeothece verrucosa PCC 7822]